MKDPIEEALDEGLPRAYPDEVYQAKAGGVFDHGYRKYGQVA